MSKPKILSDREHQLKLAEQNGYHAYPHGKLPWQYSSRNQVHLKNAWMKGFTTAQSAHIAGELE